MLDNQLRKHTSMLTAQRYTLWLTVFSSGDECVLLTVQPAELNNRSHGTEVAGMPEQSWQKMPRRRN